MSVYNIKDYGAIGNGSTDDSGAIQAAIDTAFSDGGGSVYIPATAQSYLINATIIQKSNISIVGDGNASLLKASPNIHTSCSQIISSSGQGYYTSNLIIKDVCLDGNKDAITIGDPGNEGSQSVLNYDQVDNFLLENVTIKNSIQDGFYACNSCTNATVLNCNFINNGKYGVTGGRGIVFGISPTYFKIFNNYVTNNLNQGILVQAEGGANASNFEISNNIVFSNGGIGIDLTDNTISSIIDYNIYITQGMIINNLITNNNNHGIRLSQNASANSYGAIDVTQGIIISNNSINANSGSGIVFSAPTSSKILYNNILNNSISKNSQYGIQIIGSNTQNTVIMGNISTLNTLGQYINSGTNTITQYNYGF